MTGLGENETMLILGASVIGLIAYLQIVSRRHLVAKVEVALAVGFAFIILPKGTFLSYVPKHGGAVPNTILQLILACLISQCVTIQLTKHSKNPEVLLCTYVTNVLTRSSLVLCTIHGMFYVESLSKLPCLVTMAVLVPLIIGDVFHLFHTVNKYHGTIGDPVSWYLANDAMMTFFFGIIVLVFPGVFSVDMQDDATSLFVKAFGFMIIGQSLLSFSALTFRDVEDAKAVLTAKILMHALCCVAGASSYFTDPEFWNGSHPYYLLVVSGILLYNAVHTFIDQVNE